MNIYQPKLPWGLRGVAEEKEHLLISKKQLQIKSSEGGLSNAISGVYAIFNEKKILYIGRAVLVRQRLRTHLIPPKYGFTEHALHKHIQIDDSFKALVFPIEDDAKRVAFEIELLNKINTVFNIQKR